MQRVGSAARHQAVSRAVLSRPSAAPCQTECVHRKWRHFAWHGREERL